MIQWIGFIALCRKETVRIFRIWTQTLLPSVVTTTLYYLIFGTFIGNRMGMVSGVSYMDFIVPGLVMMSVITNAFMNVVSSVFSSKFQRNIEEILVSPMSSAVVVCGFLSGGVIRGLLTGALVTGVSLFFSDLHIAHIGLAIFTVALASVLFSCLGFLNALFARKFDDISIIPTFIITPLTYLGGVFYSISMLPPFWKLVSAFNPILYVVDLFRYAYLGTSDIPIIPSFVGFVGITVLAWVIVWRLVHTGYGLRQ